MAAKRKEPLLSVTGEEINKEDTKLPLRYWPSLQVVIRNQGRLIELAGSSSDGENKFIEDHQEELEDVLVKIEEAKIKKIERLQKAEDRKRRNEEKLSTSNINELGMENTEAEIYSSEKEEAPPSLDQMANQASPGLPSSKIAEPSYHEPKPEVDVERVAVSAAIKALENFLARELTDKETEKLENEVMEWVHKSYR
ncbi:MAG: hypothetical protein FH758_03410 [Firmicutes bacterium]|nr:hypothetical protein [Bacillota bacterium]